mgnify:CR=1 FL=1
MPGCTSQGNRNVFIEHCKRWIQTQEWGALSYVNPNWSSDKMLKTLKWALQDHYPWFNAPNADKDYTLKSTFPHATHTLLAGSYKNKKLPDLYREIYQAENGDMNALKRLVVNGCGAASCYDLGVAIYKVFYFLAEDQTLESWLTTLGPSEKKLIVRYLQLGEAYTLGEDSTLQQFIDMVR